VEKISSGNRAATKNVKEIELRRKREPKCNTMGNRFEDRITGKRATITEKGLYKPSLRRGEIVRQICGNQSEYLGGSQRGAVKSPLEDKCVKMGPTIRHGGGGIRRQNDASAGRAAG